MFPRFSTVLTGAYIVITASIYVAVVWAASDRTSGNALRYYIFSAFFVLFAPKLISLFFLLMADFLRLMGWIMPKMLGSGADHMPGRRQAVSNIAIGLFSLPFVSMLYGMARTAFDFRIVSHKVPVTNLPEGLVGMKILQISDMHSGSFASDNLLAKAFDIIEKETVDMIVFTGDLVNNVASEVEPFINQFKRLRAPMGVYSVLGNHDYGDYVPWDSEDAKATNLKRLIGMHREFGWDILLNEHRVLERNGSTMAVLGVENWGAAMRFPKYGRLDDALRGTEGVPFKLLLSHDPSHWEAQVTDQHTDIQLTLSGHTHGFQFGIEIPGFKWSPVQYVYKQWAGLYEKNGQHINVNRGLGFIGYMGRVGIAPEITVLELVQA